MLPAVTHFTPVDCLLCKCLKNYHPHPTPGLFNLLNKWAEKENHWGFMGQTEYNYVNESLQINRT